MPIDPKTAATAARSGASTASELEALDEISLASVVKEINGRLGKCRTWLLQGSAWWPSLSFKQRLPRPDWTVGLEDRQPADLVAILDALSSLPIGQYETEHPLGVVCVRRRRHEILKPIADGSSVSTHHLRALAGSPSSDIRRLVAANPNLGEAEAMALAADPESIVRQSAIKAERLPAGLLLQLLGSDAQLSGAGIGLGFLGGDSPLRPSQAGSVETRYDLATIRGLSYELQAQLAVDENPYVRVCLAANPSIAQDLLALLITDKREDVRYAAAINPSISAEDLEALANDKEEGIRCCAAGNAAASVGLLLKLVKDSQSNVRERAKHKLGDRRDLSESELAVMLEDKDLRYTVAASPHIPPLLMRQLAADADPWVRVWLAMNPGASTEILALLVDDQDVNVQEKALAHRNTPLIALERAAEDKNPSFRRAVAINPSAPVRLLEGLAADSDADVRADLRWNPCLPLRIVDRITPDLDDIEKYFPALVNAARSASTSPEELRRLGRESFLIVRFVALANPCYPERARDADRASLHQEVLNNADALPLPMATAGSEPELRRALHALNLLPAKPDAKWAAKAAKSKDWLARCAVPLSGVPQNSLLQLLVDDPVDVVKQLAIKRLRAVHGPGLKP